MYLVIVGPGQKKIKVKISTLLVVSQRFVIDMTVIYREARKGHSVGW